MGAVAKDGVLPLGFFAVTHQRVGATFHKVLLERPDGDNGETENAFHFAETGAATTEGDPVRGYFFAYAVALGCIGIG